MTTLRASLCLIVLVSAQSALADKVHLNDGRKLSGTAERYGDGVALVTDDGEKLSFAREDVKRVVFESTATPKQLLEMLDEFEDLIAPAMGLGEPKQRENSTRIQRTRARNVSQGERPNWDSDRDYITEYRPRREEPVSSDRFVDDWVRFAAHFEAIAKTRTYKLHTRAKRRETSLAEFGRFPPEGHQELGEVVRDAIEAVDETFELAEKANRALAGVRAEDLRHERLLAKARNRARRTDARVTSTGEEKRLADAQVSKLQDDRVVKMKEAQLAADDAVNDVAASRIIAIQQLDEVRKMLEELVLPAPEPTPDSP